MFSININSKISAKVTLLDSTSKKINHIKELSSKYNLSTDCVSARAEDYARNNIEKFDYATARAGWSLCGIGFDSGRIFDYYDLPHSGLKEISKNQI